MGLHIFDICSSGQAFSIDEESTPGADPPRSSLSHNAKTYVAAEKFNVGEFVLLPVPSGYSLRKVPLSASCRKSL